MIADNVGWERPTWFGPGRAPLFGVVHVPADGRARAGIVLCPPVGKEHVDTYRGLKLLAQQLCALGFVVLRFDYLGTGDSAKAQRADSAIADYCDSIRVAATYLRDSGVRTVGLVGLRLGALLAAHVASSLADIAGLVLWDPVTDGRRFLREQRALYKMTVGEDLVDVVGESILGISFAPVAAGALRSLRLPTAVEPATDVLVLVRPERRSDSRLSELTATPKCTVVEVAGQPEFVAPMSFVVEIPVAALSTIASWLDETMPRNADCVAPVIRREAIVAGWGTGSPLVETIGELGPHQLFAITTAAVDVAVNPPTLLIHSTACEHRVGPGRVWTETARDLAAMGLCVIRYDRRGTGETGMATTEFSRIHSAESMDDVLDAMAATGAERDRLMMTGVCSGAWNSAYGALELGAKSVVLVNIIQYSLRGAEVGPEKLIGMTPPSPVGEPQPEPRTITSVFKKLVRRWTPHRAWLLAGSLGLIQVPEVLLKELHRKQIAVDLVLSPTDFELFDKQRGRQSVARLARKGWSPTIVTSPTGDHPLLQRDIQNFARSRLVDAVVREFAGEVSAPVVEDLVHQLSSE